MSDQDDVTCNGTGYVEIGGVEVPCYGCRDCDFEWYRDEEEHVTPF